MTLQEHLPRELPAYEVAKRPVKVFKAGAFWTWEHHCLHRRHPVNGYPHESREKATEFALDHWGRCL